jgi:hypothetical protein
MCYIISGPPYDVFSYFAYYYTRVRSTLPLAAYSALLRVVTIRSIDTLYALDGPEQPYTRKSNNLKTLTLRASPHQRNADGFQGSDGKVCDSPSEVATV